MLRKFLLIGVFTLCATLYTYGPDWSSVSAQAPNLSIPDVSDIGDATALSGVPGEAAQGNFTPGEPLTLNVDYTNDGDSRLDSPTFTVALPEGITPTEDSGWEQAGDEGDGPGGTTVYTLSPEDSGGALGSSLPPGATATAPLPVDIADTLSNEAPITVDTRFDSYDGSQEAGDRLSAQIGTMEILPVVELPDDFPTLGDTTVPTTTEEIQFAASTEDSPASTVDPATGEVVLPIEFTNTSDETIEDTLLVVEIPEGTELPPNSGWQVETITDADGNETQVAVLNVGSLDPAQSIIVPFPLLGNNVQIGDTITAPILLTANDGTVQLRDELSAILELVPTNIAETNEPVNASMLYLPLIRQ